MKLTVWSMIAAFIQFPFRVAAIDFRRDLARDFH
jgi:hypothetical protein